MHGSCLFPIYGCTNIYGFNLKDIPKIPVMLKFFYSFQNFPCPYGPPPVYVLDPDPDLYRYLSIRIRIRLLLHKSGSAALILSTVHFPSFVGWMSGMSSVILRRLRLRNTDLANLVQDTF